MYVRCMHVLYVCVAYYQNVTQFDSINVPIGQQIRYSSVPVKCYKIHVPFYAIDDVDA